MTELGKLLQQTRKKKKYSLEQVNKLTRISQKYIKALEESDASVFPAEIYHKSFLKNYAKLLGLDLDEVVKMYEQEKKGIQGELFSNDEMSVQSTASSNMKESVKKEQDKVKNRDAEIIKEKKDAKIKKIINVASKKRRIKETIDTEEDIVYDVKNETKQNLFIVKLITVIIFCVLFVLLLIIINVFFANKKSTQIKEEIDIVYNDDVSDDGKEERETVSKDYVSENLQIENESVTSEKNLNYNKQKTEIVHTNKINDNKIKNEVISSDKVLDMNKTRVENVSSERISDDNKQRNEVLSADTVLKDNKEKVEAVSVAPIAPVAGISNNDKKTYSETKKEIAKQSLEIKAKEDCWIMVFVDGNQTFADVLPAGKKQKYFADNNFTIVIENIENLKVSFNGKPVDISVGAKEDKSNTLTFKKDN